MPGGAEPPVLLPPSPNWGYRKGVKPEGSIGITGPPQRGST